MRIDIALANGHDLALEVVRAAPQLEAMGFDGLWVSEHVIATPQFARRDYGFYWLETLSSLAHLAGITRKVRLGTSILVAPYRNPLLMAKTVATIDQLSGGRVDLGVGTGWSRQEFAALGLGDWYKVRGAVTNEVLEVMRACWQGGSTVSWEGQYFRFQDVIFEPRPAQSKVPIWIGGTRPVKAPIQRVARFADVWHASELAPAALKSMGEQIDETAGRKVPRSTRLPVAEDVPVSRICDDIAAYRAVGCIQARVDFRTRGFAAYMRACEALAAELPNLRK